MKPMKFFLPGVFLLVLGAGNITVGEFKGRQYEQVLEELSGLQLPPQLINVSPLRRIQMESETDRLFQRQKNAEARRDFYKLVSFGGRVFIAMSVVLLSLGAVFSYFHFMNSRKQAE